MITFVFQIMHIKDLRFGDECFRHLALGILAYVGGPYPEKCKQQHCPTVAFYITCVSLHNWYWNKFDGDPRLEV